MNTLSLEKRTKIIQLLVEGNSIRSCSRIMDVSKCTVTKLMVNVGKACLNFHDQTVNNIQAKSVEVDELWSFVHTKQQNVRYAKKKEEVGDAWVWIGMDAETKLIISWFVGPRDSVSARLFMKDLSGRIKNKIQLTTDGFVAYPDAVKANFNSVDYVRQDKKYGIKNDAEGKVDRRKRYLGSDRIIVSGNPDMTKATTNHIERQNLTVRMSNKRFTRKTNAFSKKLINHCCSLALTFTYYNFVRIHQTLRATPAMIAGIAKGFMTIKEMVELTEIIDLDKLITPD